MRGDLVNAFKTLSARAEKYDAVIIETTGMADPAPVAFTFNTQPEVGARYKVDAIVCVVDAKHIQQHLDDEREADSEVEQRGENRQANAAKRSKDSDEEDAAKRAKRFDEEFFRQLSDSGLDVPSGERF